MPEPHDKPCSLACRLDKIVRGTGIDDGITGRLYNLEQQAQRTKQHEADVKQQEHQIRRLWIGLLVAIFAAVIALIAAVLKM